MASRDELRKIAKGRIKSAELLMRGNDWEVAAQMLGLALECALKAATCKALGLVAYPEKHKDRDFFMSHSFDRLLLLSGLTETFSAAGDAAVFSNWSGFVSFYPGDWVAMRYNDARYGPFDKPTIERLYKSLYGDDHSILKTIIQRKKW